ncbi:hypothetical protein HXX76_013822 [Chlamydomonas incerta]|uniref:Uncharacterized protein n=1 Tax=Chlamydomonas incerta TaxID=51695 RepID=A0A835SHY9_CHLIN|nr:hypothetical protein HXX76_013822 [Chlamydomonas incerta]|eukprot:KAG2425237.1 hypothetical protein HXX76_013822 [Chlamydomonas incerta]
MEEARSGRSGGGGGGSAPHRHGQGQGQRQVVDNVSTWLRADRYRRQRAVAATAVATEQVAPPAGDVAAGLSEAESGRHGDVAWPEPLPEVRAAQQPCAAYQPVIQLTPLELRIAAGAAATAATAVAGEATASPAGAAQAGEPVLSPASADAGASTAAQGGPLGAAKAPPAQDTVGSSVRDSVLAAACRLNGAPGQAPVPAAASEVGSGVGAGAGQGSSRAKNALLAALKYKKGHGPAGGSSGNGTAGRDNGGEAGQQQEVAGLKPGAEVHVEVVSGDASGAYQGRVRQLDALPESFMLCP